MTALDDAMIAIILTVFVLGLGLVIKVAILDEKKKD